MKGLLRRAVDLFAKPVETESRWTSDDHVVAAAPVEVEDFWRPATAVKASDQAPGNAPSGRSAETVGPPLLAHDALKSASCADGGPEPFLLAPSGDDWAIADLLPGAYPRGASTCPTFDYADDLPTFDVGATDAKPFAEIVDRPHRFRVDTLAGLLARETAIVGPAGRAHATMIFQNAFDEARWPRLFQSWATLAPAVSCSRTLALAFELKELWEDSPHLWQFRAAGRRLPVQHSRARQQMSWRRVLAIATNAPQEQAWRLLDDDLVDEWRELTEPGPGYWTLAEFFELRAGADEAEEHLFACLAQQGRARSALHLADGCQRFDLRTGAPAFRPGIGALIDPQIASFDYRATFLGPDLRAPPTTARAPTSREMQGDKIEA